MFGNIRLGLLIVMLALIAGCTRDYSPNTYSSAAAQQANKVVQGVVAGVREVEISPDGTVGPVTGGAAGGILGSQVPGGGVSTALSALGGTMIGGLIGSAVEHTASNTAAFEYIVRQADGELLSVTQKDTQPLAIGQKVLVISGNQARVVPDYSVPPEAPPAPATASASKQEKPVNDAPTGAAPSGDPGHPLSSGPAAASPLPAPPTEAAASDPASQPLSPQPSTEPDLDADASTAKETPVEPPSGGAPDGAEAPPAEAETKPVQ